MFDTRPHWAYMSLQNKYVVYAIPFTFIQTLHVFKRIKLTQINWKITMACRCKMWFIYSEEAVTSLLHYFVSTSLSHEKEEGTPQQYILNFGLSIHLNVHPYYVYASRSAQLRLCVLIYEI